MKFNYLLLLIIMPCLVFADAGFNIGRPKAPCYAVFKGLNNIQGYHIYRINTRSERDDNVLDSTMLLKENDSLRIYYTEGSRHWQGPIKILSVNIATGQRVDSFMLVAEGYNLTVNFTAGNNKPKYTIIKTKADYPYTLFGDDENASAGRNKYILLAMSLIGFLLLFFMISKSKKKPVQETA